MSCKRMVFRLKSELHAPIGCSSQKVVGVQKGCRFKSSVSVPLAIVMGRLCFIILAVLLVFIMGLSVINNRNRDAYAPF